MEKPPIDPVSYIRSKRTGMLIPVYDEDDTIVVLASIKAASGETESKSIRNPVEIRGADQTSAVHESTGLPEKREVICPPEKLDKSCKPDNNGKIQKEAAESDNSYSLRGGNRRRRSLRDEEKEQNESDVTVPNGLRSGKRHAGNHSVDRAGDDAGSVRRLRSDDAEDERPSKKSKNADTNSTENVGSRHKALFAKKSAVPVAGDTADELNVKLSRNAVVCVKKIMSRQNPPTHVLDLMQILRDMCPNETLPTPARAKALLELQGFCLLKGSAPAKASNARTAETDSQKKETLSTTSKPPKPFSSSFNLNHSTFTPEMEAFIRDFFRTRNPQETFGLEVSELLKTEYKCFTSEAVVNRALKTMGFQVKSCSGTTREQVLAEIRCRMSRQNDKSSIISGAATKTITLTEPRVQPLRISRSSICPPDSLADTKETRSATPSFFGDPKNQQPKTANKPAPPAAQKSQQSPPTVARKRLKGRPSTAAVLQGNNGVTEPPTFYHDLRRKRANDNSSTMPSPDTASSSSSSMQPSTGMDPLVKKKATDVKAPVPFAPETRRKFALQPLFPQIVNATGASGSKTIVTNTTSSTRVTPSLPPPAANHSVSTTVPSPVKHPLSLTISVDMWKKNVIKTLQTAYSSTLQQINDVPPDKLGETRVMRAVEILRGAFKYDYQPYVVLNMASRHLGIDLRKPLVQAHLKPYYGERNVLSAPVHVSEPLYAVVSMSSKRSDFDLLASSTSASTSSSAATNSCFDFASSPTTAASVNSGGNGLLEVKKDDPFCDDYRGSLLAAAQQSQHKSGASSTASLAAAALSPSAAAIAAQVVESSQSQSAPASLIDGPTESSAEPQVGSMPIFTSGMLPLVKEERSDINGFVLGTQNRRDLSPSRRSQSSSIVSVHNTPVKPAMAAKLQQERMQTTLLTPKAESRSMSDDAPVVAASDAANSMNTSCSTTTQTASTPAPGMASEQMPQPQHVVTDSLRAPKPEPAWPNPAPALVVADKSTISPPSDTNLLQSNYSSQTTQVVPQSVSNPQSSSSDKALQQPVLDDDIECVYIKAEKPWTATVLNPAQHSPTPTSNTLPGSSSPPKKPRVSFFGVSEGALPPGSTRSQQRTPTSESLSSAASAAVRTIRQPSPVPAKPPSPTKANLFTANFSAPDSSLRRSPSPSKQRPLSPSKLAKFPQDNGSASTRTPAVAEAVAALPKISVGRSDYKFDKEFASELAETQRKLFDPLNIDDSSLFDDAARSLSDSRPVAGGVAAGDVADADSSSESQLLPYEEDIMILEIFANAASSLRDKVASPKVCTTAETVDANAAAAADDKQTLRTQLGIAEISTSVVLSSPEYAVQTDIGHQNVSISPNTVAEREEEDELVVAAAEKSVHSPLKLTSEEFVPSSSAPPTTGGADFALDNYPVITSSEVPVSGAAIGAGAAIAADDKQALRIQLGIAALPANVVSSDVHDAVQTDTSSAHRSGCLSPATETATVDDSVAVFVGENSPLVPAANNAVLSNPSPLPTAEVLDTTKYFVCSAENAAGESLPSASSAGEDTLPQEMRLM